jgi:hypothetical protein
MRIADKQIVAGVQTGSESRADLLAGIRTSEVAGEAGEARRVRLESHDRVLIGVLEIGEEE